MGETDPVPTGTALRDVRAQLFAAAERILLRAGPEALTSRAVTTEAGCAKGVLHRHFEDFDAFLAEFVLARIERMDDQTANLREAAGTGEVAENLTNALVSLFDSAAVAVVALVTFRDELRARLRMAYPAGVPVLTNAMTIIGDYLAAERDLGRVPAEAPIDVHAAMLIGSAHLLYADRTGPNPATEEVRRMVATVLGGPVPEIGLPRKQGQLSRSRAAGSAQNARNLS
jgi:AcrR family transcriptional regulator